MTKKEEKELVRIFKAACKLQQLLHDSSYYQKDVDIDNCDYLLAGLINLNCGLNDAIREFIAREKKLQNY